MLDRQFLAASALVSDSGNVDFAFLVFSNALGNCVPIHAGYFDQVDATPRNGVLIEPLPLLRRTMLICMKSMIELETKVDAAF